ncbi:hypothetical protein HDU76_003303 [Blyttiomyces sp. JEL0837]|nr:hypothetical protein HDU76_003303 [Blyttiomyces sp. JEL0837]
MANKQQVVDDVEADQIRLTQVVRLVRDTAVSLIVPAAGRETHLELTLTSSGILSWKPATGVPLAAGQGAMTKANNSPSAGFLKTLLAVLGLGSPSAPRQQIRLPFVIAARSNPSRDRLPDASLAATSTSSLPAFADSLNSTVFSLHFLDHGVHDWEFLTPPDNKKPAYRIITLQCETVDQKRDILRHLKQGGVSVPELKDSGKIRKKILLIVNPFGGIKEATKIFQTIVQPTFALAAIDFEKIDTTHKHHAEEIARSVNVNDYSSVVSVSGDGVFHEIVNGLLTRKDWREVSHIPVGTIGAGSSNAMNRNLDCMFPEYGALCVARGEFQPMDVISATFHQSKKVYYSHLNFAYAYVADLDIETDDFRWMGREKVTFSALRRLIYLRRYRAKISVMPIDQSLDITDADDSLSYGPPRTLSASSQNPSTWPLQIDPKKDPITYFTACNMPWVGTDFMAAKDARLGNGCIELTIGKRVPRMSILSAFLDQKLSEDEEKAGLKTYPVRGFYLEPIGWSWNMNGWAEGMEDVEIAKLVKTKGNHIAMSGEPFKSEPCTVEVHPSALFVITPEWLLEGARPKVTAQKK